MKMISLVALMLVVSGCALDNGTGAENDPNTCCNSNPMTMVFKTSTGRISASVGDVTAVEIAVYSSPNGQVDSERTFRGTRAIQIVRSFGLSAPKEVGMPASINTGRIIIWYKNSGTVIENARTFSIQNSRLLKDDSYPEVTYSPLQTIDLKWLLSQPEN
jgi:hypothetical protein